MTGKLIHNSGAIFAVFGNVNIEFAEYTEARNFMLENWFEFDHDYTDEGDLIEIWTSII